MNTTQTEHITLYYRQGSSDKVYQASIESQGELLVVNFAYGRRGSTMTTGTKTQTPVDYDSARNIYDQLVREKKAKGYTEGPDGTPYQHSDQASRVTGFLPQLLNPIDEKAVERLLKDPCWALQEKLDGRRVVVRKAGAEIQGINRKGLLIGLPSPIVIGAHKIGNDFILDGECVGDVLYAFDLLEWDGEDYRPKPYQHRFIKLSNLVNKPDSSHIEFLVTATDAAGKERLFRQLRAAKKEGVVFKRLDAPYTPGRPNSGGTQLKHKFYATCSAVVSKVNDKRSVELLLLNGKRWISVGNVTIPANFNVPAVGEVVEVRFLYAFRESNALYQAVYLGPRQDVEPHECVLSQLKYKGTGEEELC
jgi:bifunctional non-homologous end joining protein LigD